MEERGERERLNEYAGYVQSRQYDHIPVSFLSFCFATGFTHK